MFHKKIEYFHKLQKNHTKLYFVQNFRGLVQRVRWQDPMKLIRFRGSDLYSPRPPKIEGTPKPGGTPVLIFRM